ncbi:MAG: glycosyltransferase family 2 protein [Bryobacteraceae bacterium]|nr:glycosyltransferase family 2 protein [Bryobacteraceae bacterium]
MEPRSFQAALVVPAYNEEESIGASLDAIPGGLFARIVVAVNGTSDRTADIARARGAQVVEVAERGYGAACLAALEVVTEPVVAFLQADGSEDPREAWALARRVADGECDFALGDRHTATRPHQRAGNALAVWLIRLIWGYRYRDLGPLRAIRTDALRALKMRDRNYGWTVEMQIRAVETGLRIVETPVRQGARVAGEEKVSGNWRASVRAGWVILRTVGRLALTKSRRWAASPSRQAGGTVRPEVTRPPAEPAREIR